jgi:ligand-binding SRPBCC domain-containing protein
LVTEQTEGPFKRWNSIQEFNRQENATHVRHTIQYELPTSGKIVNFLSSSGADSKIEEGLHQAANAVKQKLESA